MACGGSFRLVGMALAYHLFAKVCQYHEYHVLLEDNS